MTLREVADLIEELGKAGEFIAEARVLITVRNAEGTTEKTISLPERGIGFLQKGEPEAVVVAIYDLKTLLSQRLDNYKCPEEWAIGLLKELDCTYSSDPGLLLVEEKLKQQPIIIYDALSVCQRFVVEGLALIMGLMTMLFIMFLKN